MNFYLLIGLFNVLLVSAASIAVLRNDYRFAAFLAGCSFSTIAVLI